MQLRGFTLLPPFCSIQAPNRLRMPAHTGEGDLPYSVLTQALSHTHSEMRLYQLSAHPLIQSSRHINLTITVTAAPGEVYLLPQPRVPHLRNGLSLLPWDGWRGVTMKATKMGAWPWRR